MIIIPAIDLYQKKVVRLVKGKESNCKIYSNNPIFVAKKWKDQGAKWLHLVDLSAAFSKGGNEEIIKNIIKNVDISVEVGGGIRSLEKIEQLISIGAKRLILGTKATDPDFLKKALKIAGDKITVAVDEKEGKLAVKGWQESINLPIVNYLDYLKKQGIKWIIYTDISRDGTLEGFNFDRIKQISQDYHLNLIFSGGVSSLDDIKKLKEVVPQAAGVIVGKALYEKKFSLEEAITI
ncbi:MAG: 1-(5-phosphoribosyl)-5-[(5-phosphoribosylamino)methylideneamino]imidazole-4-carboxamide isomerase [Candidatus Omnitrophica bacterium]|nr:1-(5-phosphoribosyl)-5-[(5-phosphoribosylamino)methylideneamino]imidazole-4-carboxamide isomerase [Candidatus Omnitrophota bacterium]MCF7887813.1 1-(5-phosphoribosyl)-5-[(5-phosphoribosylamino)methylideneamino]imidazole-4-carboxamide isomerase [Candidatus Omnitrophota bacterium]